jgi:hypothetical protein
MNQQQDLASAVMKRDRSRSRVRMLTVTVGAASLATAGVVAYNLPGSTHTTAVSGSNNTTTTPSAQPSAANQQPTDDGGDGSSGAVTAPSGTFGQAPAQATSGGS